MGSQLSSSENLQFKICLPHQPPRSKICFGNVLPDQTWLGLTFFCPRSFHTTRFITGEWPLASPASRFCAYCLISVLHLVDLFAHANFFSSFFVFLFLFSPPPSITIVFLLLLLFSPPYYFFSFTSFFPSTLSFLSIAHPVIPVIQIPNKISGSRFNIADPSGQYLMAITRLKIITCIQFQCTPVQLEILRRAGAMPISSR